MASFNALYLFNYREGRERDKQLVTGIMSYHTDHLSFISATQ